MKVLLSTLILSSLLFASGADAVKVPRAKIENVEKLINTQMASLYPDEPYFLLGLARGVYLDGVGAVFSAEINLAIGPALSPFKQSVSKEEITRHHDKKEVRLPLLRNKMAATVASMASYLETLPPNEEFVLAVTLLRYPWEDAAAFPSQIVMRVQRAKLMEVQRANAKPASIIKVQEY